MSANKIPTTDRVREMSKQEEILLRKKREIEMKLKSPEASSQIVQDVAPNFSSSTKSTVPVKSNKFTNDGSFAKQFRMLQQLKSQKVVQEHSETKPKVNVMQNEAFEDKQKPNFSHQQVVPERKSKLSYIPVKDEISLKTEVGIDGNVNMDNEPMTSEQSDWFKDALKRAQEKAKQLTAITTVVDSRRNPSQMAGMSDEPMAKKPRAEFTRTSDITAIPVPSALPIVPIVPIVPQLSQGASWNIPGNLMEMVPEGQHYEAIHGVMVTRLTRNNPAIIAYARQVFGSTDLTDSQWKQCEEQMKMNVVFQLLQAKKMEVDRLAEAGKVKYEYDSDEETEGGTWEHKARAKEMMDTKIKATELTRKAEGKHHIGDFLPPEELAKFMEKFRALKEGRDPDMSQFQQNKITEDNVGFRMLKSMGWTEGMGLGMQGQGIVNPINPNGRSDNEGLGADRPDNLCDEDDEFDAYRKRMMLAYRFRPNPLNNPRRTYY